MWLRSSELGDEQDRVLIRSDGRPTYTATDIAYHYDKFFVRGFDRVIDVWGADHQGHVPSMKALVRALGAEPERFDILHLPDGQRDARRQAGADGQARRATSSRCARCSTRSASTPRAGSWSAAAPTR